MKLLIKIGVGVSVALNLFVFTVAMYGLITREARVEENRKWLTEQIEKEVHQSVNLMMPLTTGKVNVGNK
ncbi:MAG: hypothetical protein CM15mL4_0380 [uncultured marine virus]|nr:MAG: hypothetical protein CM15mL4_0380 [uncultured marine virus]